MVSVDDHTQTAIEIVSTGVKLSEDLILSVLKSLETLFNKKDEEQNFAIKDNTIEGKQKIKDLVSKHKDGVMALEDNISKEQLKDYQNEFKKMGVDFSVIKNDTDSFSFFFASRDANVIEKSLKNIIERKNKSLDKENEVSTEPKKEVVEDLTRNNEKAISDKFKNITAADAFEEAMAIQENAGFGSNTVNWDDEKLLSSLRNVDPQAHTDFLHLKEVNLNEKKQPEIEIKSPNKDLSVDEKRNELSDKFSSKEAQLDSVLNQLDPKEKDLFMQISKSELEKGPVFKEFTKLMEIRENLSSEQILKVNELHSRNVFKGEEGKEAPKGKINMKDIEGVASNLTRQKEKQTEKEQSPSIYSVKGVKEIDKKLKEQDKDKNKDKKRTQSLSR